MTFYVTKYALTSGIRKVDGKISEGTPYILHVVENGWSDYFFVEGRDWHRTIEAAQDRVEFLRAKKILSLQKQISKLEGWRR